MNLTNVCQELTSINSREKSLTNKPTRLRDLYDETADVFICGG